MNYYLSVESGNLLLRKGNLKGFIDTISILDENADLWFLKHKSMMEEDDTFMISSSVHWDFVMKNKSMGYALSDNVEIIINHDKLKKDGDHLIRETDKGGLVFKKNSDNLLELVNYFSKE